MTKTERVPDLTELHWVVLGLVSTWGMGALDVLASELDLDVDHVERLCGDLEALGWIERVGVH